jgi:MYXO-CTERM domain-containing protein
LQIDNDLYEISARSYDGSECSDECYINVYVENEGDNTVPTCSISSLDNGEEVTGTIEISGTAEDTDGSIQKVIVRVDSGDWENAEGTNSWSFTLDTTGLSDGTHTISVRSMDDESVYSSSSTVNVVVGNGVGGAGSKGTYVMVLSIITGLVLLFALVFLLARRRRDNRSSIPLDHYQWAEAVVLEDDEDHRRG